MLAQIAQCPCRDAGWHEHVGCPKCGCEFGTNYAVENPIIAIYRDRPRRSRRVTTRVSPSPKTPSSFCSSVRPSR
jgi:hypothetical protein